MTGAETKREKRQLEGRDTAQNRRKQNKNSLKDLNNSLSEKKEGVVSRETRQNALLKIQKKLLEIKNVVIKFLKCASVGKQRTFQRKKEKCFLN